MKKYLSIQVVNGFATPIDTIPIGCPICHRLWIGQPTIQSGIKYQCDCGCWCYVGDVAFSERRRPAPIDKSLWRKSEAMRS